MQIGYARSSTVDQEAGFQAQIKSLKAAGCEKIFAEKVSSVAERAQLEAALDYAREATFSSSQSSTGLHGACPTSLPLVAGWKRRPSLLGCLSKPSTRPIAPAV